MKYGLLAILIIANTLGLAQNLVPNPSFEKYDNCPQSSGQLNQADPWYKSSRSPDLYNECSSNQVGIPYNLGGFQYANYGKGYAGLSTYDAFFNTREMISVKLIDTLEIGKSYRFEFFVNPADRFTYGTNNFGVFFSNDSINFNDYNYTVTPQINFDEIVSDTSLWTQLSGIYTAIGGERYITIGNFYSNNATNTKVINDTIQYPYAYYYIDDISLIETDMPVDNSNILLYPNPTIDILNINLYNIEGDSKTLQVYNAIGQLIFTENINSDTYSINTASLANGAYTITVVDNKKYLAHKKFVVVH